MTQTVPYDRFAEIYERWVSSVAAITEPNRAFYLRRFVAAEGPVVELGVGDGRIAVEAARRGKPMIGVDNSKGMLALCRKRAKDAGVERDLTLLHADFRDFTLDAPAALIAIPFHSIGHMLTREDRLACVHNVRHQLAPGGRFLFDHFVADEEYARKSDGVPVLRDERKEGAYESRLWATTTFDFDAQVMTIRAATERVDAAGVVIERVEQPTLSLGWIDPEDARALLIEADFDIEACYGDFDETPFGEESRAQVWVARVPG